MKINFQIEVNCTLIPLSLDIEDHILKDLVEDGLQSDMSEEEIQNYADQEVTSYLQEIFSTANYLVHIRSQVEELIKEVE